MKPTLLLILIVLPFLVQAQLTFEEITTPNDFSLRLLRKSPTGEYFMQLANDYSGIHTSTNGVDWIRHPFSSIYVHDIQFFSDGTPMLHCSDKDDFIRRNGSWIPLDEGTGWNDIHMSDIRADTLFVFKNKRFAFSTDKGLTYTVLDGHSEYIDTLQGNLYVFDHHFALHGSTYTIDSLIIFNRRGERVKAFPIDLKYPDHIVYNDCNELLLINNDDYYLFSEAGLQITSGKRADILPDSVYYRYIQAAHGQYYIQRGNTVYTTGCGSFDWQPVFQDVLLDSLNRLWWSREGDILLFNHFGNTFYNQAGWTATRTKFKPDINFPCLSDENETVFSRQLARTANGTFTKLLSENEWSKPPAIQDGETVTYSPDGDLYVSRPNEILYSTDNGATTSAIQLPFGQPFPYLTYKLFIPGDSILFLHRAYYTNYISYYSTNHGVDWKPVSLQTNFDPPVIKQVGNQIQIAYLNNEFSVFRIHLGTGDVTSRSIGEYAHTWQGAVTDDGTIYFMASDNSWEPRSLYRYRFGEDPEWLGNPPLPTKFIASGNTVYAVSETHYYTINEGQIKQYPCIGLPDLDYPVFKKSANDHLYVVYGQNRVFRSNEILSFDRFISGSVYHNTLEDCVPDTLDQGLGSWVITMESDQLLRTTPTTADGGFKSDLPTGEYTVSVKPISQYWKVCDSTFQVIVDSSGVVFSQDFLAIGLDHCAKMDFDFSSPLLRRCFPNIYYFTVRNTGPETGTGATVRITLDPYFEIISTSIPYTQVSTHVLEFDLGIIAVNEVATFQVVVMISCNAALGTLHCVEGIVYDDLLCDDDHTTYKECQENIGSFDPNDKRVFNEAGQETVQVDKDEYLYYHIRFQNTGTDTAFTVRIQDPLSAMLDYNTLEMLSASHPYTWFINDGPALNILFENIMLPDSNINEPASHGYVKFRIKPLPEFDYGTSIPNTAGIYFDFNDPVLTNTVTTVILPLVKTFDPVDPIDFAISPNPANGFIHIAISPADLVKADVCEVIDLFGRRLLSAAMLTSEQEIDISGLTPGMYTVVLLKHGVAVGAKKFARL